MNTIGERIRQRRIELGLSQKELGAGVRLSQAAIFKIEQGGKTRRLPELAKALHVSLSWLCHGQGPTPAPRGYWPFVHASLEDYERLPESKKQELDTRISEFIAGASGDGPSCDEAEEAIIRYFKDYRPR